MHVVVTNYFSPSERDRLEKGRGSERGREGEREKEREGLKERALLKTLVQIWCNWFRPAG